MFPNNMGNQKRVEGGRLRSIELVHFLLSTFHGIKSELHADE
ncbi:hypothetical protein BH18THE2_BH18THE2_11610 [soil metagenome]